MGLPVGTFKAMRHEEDAMSKPAPGGETIKLSNGAGLSAQLNANRSLRRFECGNVSLLLFPGNQMEAGVTNLYLRRHGDPLQWTSLLGPRADSGVSGATRSDTAPNPTRWRASGGWLGLRYVLELRLAASEAAWFWVLTLCNDTGTAQTLDLTYVQDLALTSYGAARNNEYYCSQYIDHTPLLHGSRGYLVGSRQNQAVEGRYPWTLIGSLRRAGTYATDALQFHGLSARAAGLENIPPGLQAELPSRRLQHEHSAVILRGEPLHLQAGESASCGFFGLFLPDHREASSDADLARLPAILALPEAALGETAGVQPDVSAGIPGSLFTEAAPLETLDPTDSELQQHCPGPWRHVERDAQGRVLSFFHGADHHAVVRAKELQVLRPHGQLLRTGRHQTPAESALTSTVWMGGVFHSMVAQGHVNINRFLSTVRSYLGLFRSQGQRVFVQLEGRWQLLHLPSVFDMTAQSCRWLYRHPHGLIEVRASAHSDPHALKLAVRVLEGPASRFLISHHVAFSADDGAAGGAIPWQQQGQAIRVFPPEGSELADRFPGGCFCLTMGAGAQLERVGGDELLYADGLSRDQSYLCLLSAPERQLELQLCGELVREETQSPIYAASVEELTPQVPIELAARPGAAAPASNQSGRLAKAQAAARLGEILPWFAQNAWVHFLSPRGLEQFSGGGWGTRDVCQGPVELLLGLGRTEPIRDILLRVMRAQNPDGDWPQWFMMFERERLIRAGDSHGDIVLWPLVVVAQYLMASGDAAVLDEAVPFFDARGPEAAESASVWQHVERALTLVRRRAVPGSQLAAYGHGDWNDSLQPADPRLREHMCSAWTVTLQVQALRALAAALRHVGRDAARAAQLATQAEAVHADFQRLLIADGVLTGYAIFETDGKPRYLLHPRDQLTGVHYSALGMIHAILEDLFTPAQAREHLRLLEERLSGPDGVRLFDLPLPYHGGPQRIFQRAESATFFGREIGLMYTHAHLRYAQALAHLGEADRFLHALSQAVPIEVQSVIASADRRQANCYFSSSDAAFADRYEARADYHRVRDGDIALDGGWRVYSSGAGIVVGLILRRFLGWEVRRDALRLDPVIPGALDGLRTTLPLWGSSLQVRYRIGAAGCGVQTLKLNGQALRFERETHAHRPGAALAAREPLQALLRAGANELEIALG
ncbi:MAG TPA: hypothetical protein VHY19_13565 [Steroidobacteraceae bacterium]|jgi:cellobiose phosphorylase|nr:hypothetical protein [Steroidobacteraceae bacterium]